MLNVKNLSCWRLDEPWDLLTPLVAGISWKGRKDAIVCLHGDVCDESRDTKTFPVLEWELLLIAGC